MNKQPTFKDSDGLSQMLAQWAAPSASPALDGRVRDSYRQMLAEKSLFVESPQGQPFSENEENPMKNYPQSIYTRPEYHLTVLEDAALTRRLARELSALKAQSALTWPELKRDPQGFARRAGAALAALLFNFFRSPYAMTATVSAVFLVMTAIVAVVIADSLRSRAAQEGEKLEISELINLNENAPREEKPPEKEGAAGNNKGAGGGSKPLSEKPRGGGGGGDVNETRPVNGGEVPQMSRDPQVVVPQPQNAPERPPLLPVTPTLKGDEALSRPPRSLNFGDPDSQANEISRGNGAGDGYGTGKGNGAGGGNGDGLGQGNGENTGGKGTVYGGGGPGGENGEGALPKPKPKVNHDGPFTVKNVDRKAQILARPEPAYTDEARREQITGVVSLRVLLNANGTVSQISPISRLPHGLTDKAIEAARKIRFTPAQKDGRNVSQWLVLQYEFNLY